MRLPEERMLRSVVIAGSGLDAWLTAAVLAHRLDGREIDITVCPVSGSQEWDALYTAMPSFPGDLLRELGYSDLKLARASDASFSLGTRVSGPGLDGVAKPHGPVGINVGGVGFHQYWRRTSARLSPEDYFRYSPGAEAMKRDLFAPPVAANAIGPLQHEMVRHVDPWALQKQLRHQAYAMGVREARGPVETVERRESGEFIEAVVTSRGERLGADLYIDCSGPLRAIAGPERDWQPAPLSSDWRLWSEHRHRNGAPRAYASMAAGESGWRFGFPRGSEDVTLVIGHEGAPEQSHPWRTGHLTEPWKHNCVALGIAAASLLPVDTLQPRLLMAGIERLVRLLPGRDCAASETREFNQLSAQDADEAHALAAVYEAWRQGMAPQEAAAAGWFPDSLALRVRLFARRGWISPRDSQLVPDDSWRAAFILLGVIPDHHDRLADRIQRDEVEENLLALKHRVSEVVRVFPPYDEYFAALRAAMAESG